MAEPFRYAYHESPYVGSISQLIAAPGEAYARAAEVGGNAQANAALQRGAAYSGAAQQIGQSIAAIPSQIQQAKAQQQNTAIRAQQLEAGNLQIGEQKRAISARDAFAKIIKDTPQLNEDGVSLYDIPAVAQQLAASGQDPAIAVEHLGKLNDAFRAEKAAKLSLVKTGAASVAAAGNDPVLANHFLDQLERNGTYPKEQVKQFRDIIDADPANVAKLTAYLMGPQKMERGAPGSVAVNPLTGLPVAGSAVPDPKTEAEAKQTADRQAEIARHNKETERIAGLNAGKAEAAQQETARHNRAMEKAADPFGGLTAGGGRGIDLNALPKEIRDQAQALVEGRRSLDPRLANKPYGQSIINAAYAIDPTFDQGNYNARVKARSDLVSPNGSGGKTIGALNTAIQHAGTLSDLIETLDNYEIPLANALVNPLRSATGSTKVTNFDTVAPQLAKEIERVWRGAGGTAGEIHDLIETIGHNKGKQQQREALQQFVELAKGKLDTLERQRDSALGPTVGKTIPILFNENQPIIDTIATRASGKPASTLPTSVTVTKRP